VLGLSVKRYPRVLGLAATPDSIVIFIIQIIIFLILIIILNLHDLSLSEFACKVRLKSLGSCCNTKPKSLGYESGCKVVS
jgi:hypothetical protein